MSITDYNGGTLVAMTGKDCVVIGSDLRLGIQMQTIQTDKEKVYRFDDRLFVGLAGLGTDATTVVDTMQFRAGMYKLREDRPLRPRVLTAMLSNYLYEKRFGPFFTEPIVAGLDPSTEEAEVYSMDLIGCVTRPKDFVCSGTEADTVMGMCESVWEPGMDEDTLFTAASQAFLSAMEQVTISGWGAVMYVVTPDKVTRKLIKARLD